MTSTRMGFVVVVLGVVMCSAWPQHTALNNPNEGVRVFSVKALVEHHTWSLGDVLQSWGFIDDKAHCDAVSPGAVCASKAPYPTMMAAAAYALWPTHLARTELTWFCRLFGSVLPALCMFFFAFRQLHRSLHLHNDTTMCLAVALLTGSGVWAGMQVFSGHATSAAALLWMLACVLHANPTVRTAAIAGGCAGVALGCEYTSVLVVMPTALWAVWQWRQQKYLVASAVIAGLIAVLPMAVAHTIQFGLPWRTGYASLDNPAYATLVDSRGFRLNFGAVVAALFSPEVGLVFFSPWLCIAAWGVRTCTRSERVMLGTGTLLMLLFAAMFPGWRGGWSVGWRYGLPLVVLWCVPVARILSTSKMNVPMQISITLAVVHAGFAGAFFPHLSDAQQAPVYRFLLPAIMDGFAPAGLTTWSGLPTPWAAWTCATLVLLPWWLCVRSMRARMIVVAVVASSFALTQGLPAHPRTDAESTRLRSLWQPPRAP
jgi:hypothetical protein